MFLWNGAKAAGGIAAVARNPASCVPGCPRRRRLLRSAAGKEIGALKTREERVREIEALRASISRLSAANLRISESPDLETVLREALEGARYLTGARCGAVATLDEAGQPEALVTSGVAEERRRRLAAWPDGLRFIEHVRELAAPLRLADVPSYVRSLGFVPDQGLPPTLLGMPIRHRGVDVGYVFLAEREGEGRFTGEDEEFLGLVALAAGAAIANLRTRSAAQRLRADLQAVIDTAPVGVVVFGAGTGDVLWINREAKRLVEEMRIPGHGTEHLLNVLTFRRADGRESNFSETPMARELDNSETVRAEEIVVSVPDGRKVTLLVNATPNRTADGTVVSLIVALQDLAPIQELERLRAQFMSMVSHELRAPLTSIKGSAATLLEASSDLDPEEMHEFFRIIVDQTDHMRGLISDLLDAGRIESGTLSVSPEPSDVGGLVDRARNTFLSGGGRHTVLIDMPPDLPPVMADRRRIAQVLNNLFSNAARHAAESSPIRVTALRDGVHVAVSVSDEGRGVPPERLPHLFQKYAGVGEGDGERGLAGTGLGLAICKGLVEAHGGRIRAESGGTGQGTRVTFTLPVAEAAGAGSAPEAGRLRPLGEGGNEPRILVVEDDPRMLRYVRDALSAAGYAPLVTGDPRDLSRIIKEEKPRLVVLDLMLPETDGIELMKSIPELADLPVVFISAYGRDETIAVALEAGAADYIVKPFSTTELTARIRAALRRRAEPELFVLGKLAIRYDQRQVSVAGRPVELTASEYALLRALSLNEGRVSGYEALVRQVSGKHYNRDARVALRSLVKNLRRKLGDDAGNPAYILNKRGVGYRMPRPDGP